MKKLVLVVLAASLLGFFQNAQAEDVKSVNVVGFYKVTVPPLGKQVLCAVQLDAIDPADQNLLGILGTNNLTSGQVPSLADRVYLFDTATAKWKQYFMWTNMQFSSTVAPYAPTNPVMNTGEGFFIQSRGSASAEKTVTFAGQVVDVATNVTWIASGMQILGYPFSCGSSLDDLNLKNLTPARGGAVPSLSDRVYTHDSATGYKQYWLKQTTSVTNWYLTTDLTGTTPVNPSLALGQGFFYQAKSTGTPFAWTETNPYIGNL